MTSEDILGKKKIYRFIFILRLFLVSMSFKFSLKQRNEYKWFYKFTNFTKYSHEM